MKVKYILLVVLFIPYVLKSQMGYVEEEINTDGIYSSLHIALKNKDDVKSLKLEGDSIDIFLNKVSEFRSIEKLELVSHSAGFFTTEQYECIAKLVTLKKLFIYRSGMGYIPQSVSAMPNLKALIISRGSFVRFGENFFTGTNIPVMKFGACGIFNLQEFTADSCNTKVLSLERNYIREIPESIKDLNKLELLNISHNKFQKFPEQILSLHALRVLNISFNEIDTLPPEISKLENLEMLFLTKTRIHRLPNTIKDMKNLKEILMSDIYLSDAEKSNIINQLPENCKITWTTDEYLHDLEVLY